MSKGSYFYDRAENPYFYHRRIDRGRFRAYCKKCDDTATAKILEEAAIVNECLDRGKFTPLHLAEKYYTSKTVDPFLDHDARINATVAMGRIPLDLANEENVYRRMNKSLLWLGIGANVNAMMRKGVTTIQKAVASRNWSLIETLLEKRAFLKLDEHYELLYEACYQGNLNALKMLLKYSSDLGGRSWEGKTLLHVTIEMNIRKRKSKIRREVIKFLVQLIGVDCTDSEGRTPLHLACKNRYTYGVETLIQCGASVDAKDVHRRTPAQYYSEPDECKSEIPEIMLTHVEKLRISGLRRISRELDIVNMFLTYYVDTKVLEKIKTSCQDEFDRMKAVRLDSYTSLDMLLSKNLTEMARHVKNPEVQRIIQSPSFQKDFPLYHSLIREQYSKGCARAILLESAKDGIEILMKTSLPDRCLEKILCYVGDKQLKDFQKVSEE